MKTNFSDVHSISRCLIVEFLHSRYRHIVDCKGCVSLYTIISTADVLTSYNELSGLDFFIHLRPLPGIKFNIFDLY